MIPTWKQAMRIAADPVLSDHFLPDWMLGDTTQERRARYLTTLRLGSPPADAAATKRFCEIMGLQPPD